MNGNKAQIVGTLVVIVLVLGIIATIGVAIPWYSKKKEQKRREKATENLRKMGEALLQYSGDYGDFFPSTTTDSDTYMPPKTDAGSSSDSDVIYGLPDK